MTQTPSINSGRSPSADGYPLETVKTAAPMEEIVRRTMEHLQQKVRVQQAILFGSHAQGEADA